jgi:cell wall-associated NlpC family hydrolase
VVARRPAPAPVDHELPRENARSVAEALSWARAQAASPTRDWYRRCLNMMAQAYGWDASGVPYAIDHFSAVPASMRHTDRNPPAGALVYWRTGSRAGHVALSMGNGMVASNDIRRNGGVAIVPMTEIESEWGADYVGWTPPYFPRAAG